MAIGTLISCFSICWNSSTSKSLLTGVLVNEVRYTLVGTSTIGSNPSITHSPAKIPVTHTMPYSAASPRECLSVTVPTSSNTLFAPFGAIANSFSGKLSSSSKIWSAPDCFKSSIFSGFLVVEITLAPILLASCRAASPTELVPPRISSVSPRVSFKVSINEA
ncbi:hypothetical protein D3C81_1540260 [compost metagenome]